MGLISKMIKNLFNVEFAHCKNITAIKKNGWDDAVFFCHSLYLI